MMERLRNGSNNISTMKWSLPDPMFGLNWPIFTPISEKPLPLKMRKRTQLGNWRLSNKVTETLKNWLTNFNSWSLKQDSTKTTRCWSTLTDEPWTLNLLTRLCIPQISPSCGNQCYLQERMVLHCSTIWPDSPRSSRSHEGMTTNWELMICSKEYQQQLETSIQLCTTTTAWPKCYGHWHDYNGPQCHVLWRMRQLFAQ